MFCRRALQRVGPLAWRAFEPTSRNVRHMAFGVPGGSSNMAYFVLCGGGLTAAVIYAYKKVGGDGEDKLANTASTAKAPEVATPAAEPAPVEEAVPAPEVVAEVVAESVPAPAEPVAEAMSEEAAAVVVSEPAATEEAAAPPAAVEAAPVTKEVAATEEMPAEAPAEESAGMAVVDEVLPAPAAKAETGSAAPEAEATPAAEVAA
ncbi:induced stolen tip protein TUB8-like isoform X1 [Anarrhichthys ocellatus]|uniref:induced stolen tip protein TUB8-like isoform X1 n=1 Tax=Anarrhichthys ocellatus TaxID=433405 RepID=UPI0012ED6384|nr:induced stolen tip protein TUB8-like isoform X1 [Anarrhichthys ocellatus]